MVNFRNELAQTLQAPGSTIADLRRLLIRTLQGGMERKELLNQMEALREGLSSEQEDLSLDAMDLLVGWSSPHMKISDE
jgi:hypothetical protein